MNENQVFEQYIKGKISANTEKIYREGFVDIENPGFPSHLISMFSSDFKLNEFSIGEKNFIRIQKPNKMNPQLLLD